MNFRDRTPIRVLAVIALVAPVCLAQTTLKGGVSQNQINGAADQANQTYKEVFAGQNPLSGAPEIMGMASTAQGPKCLAPDSTWKLVAQRDGTCYFWVLFDKPIAGCVVPVSQIDLVRRIGGECGGHPYDKTLAICSKCTPPPNVLQPPPNLLKGTTAANGACSGGFRVPHATFLPKAGLYEARYDCRYDTATDSHICCQKGFWNPYDGPIPTPQQISGGTGGGYNPCLNPTPPPECRQGPIASNPTALPPANDPVSDSLQYLRGMAQGLGDCGKLGQDLLAAAASMARGDFVTAAQTLGLQPGESVTLRAIYSEASTKVLGTSAFEAGRIAGRRICTYGVIPGGLKAAKSLRGIRTAGRTRYNPLSGNAIAEGATADAAAPPGQSTLPGKWVDSPKGPVEIGDLVGAGKFGNVYKLPSMPGKVVKIGNANPNSPASFPRQVEGSNALRNAGIPTPAIDRGPIASPRGGPPMLFMDDIFNKWPGAQIIKDVGNVTPAQWNAIQNLYKQIGSGGNIWVDGHTSNIFFFDGAGGVSAGVVDADMVFAEDAFQAQGAIIKNNLGDLLLRAGQGRLVLGNSLNAGSIMDALFQIRFGN